MTSLGDTLRRERLKKNVGLDRVSNELKISARLLGAIEEERFDKLPGGVFTKSFVLQYARYLGLDEDEISVELHRIFDPQPTATGSSQATKPHSDISLPRVKDWEAAGEQRYRWTSSLPALALVVIVILGCAGVYSWWQRTRRASAAQSHPAVTQSAAAPQTSPAAPAQAQPAPDPAAGPAVQPSPASSAEQSSEPKVSAAPPAGNTQAVASQPNGAELAAAPQPNPNAAVRVQLTAEEPVWVSARTDGKYVFSDTLQPNQSRTVEANSNVVLRLGNAGGVTILLNGKPIGPVGPKGQIRTVQLTPGGFQIVPPDAPKPAPPPAGAEPLEPL